jgi:nucleotide-binding universal stress UspA family protein
MNERRPLGNVLVATDFSGAATNAVERAARLPIGSGSVLTVLHVLPPRRKADERAEAERSLRYAASAAADSAARIGRKDLQVFPRLVEGTPFVEIVRAARHGRNELVVVGRHGDRTFRELLIGSTAERVLRKGDTSVLVVASRPAAQYEHPMVAVDCSDASRGAIELAWRLADASARALEVVHAYEPVPESALKRAGIFGEAARQQHVQAREQATAAVEAFLGSRGPIRFELEVREGDARRVILDTAAQHGCDLLTLATHGRSGRAHVLLGSVAEAVVRAAHCDVAVARAMEGAFELP